MSLNAVSTSSHRTLIQNPAVSDPRLLANAGEEDSCWSTAAKVLAVVGGLITSIGSFALFGPLVGSVVTLISGIGTLLLFNSCDDSVPEHNHSYSAPLVPSPWYHRFFPVSSTTPQNVPIRRGAPHVPVGRGHIVVPQTPQPIQYVPVVERAPVYFPHEQIGGGLFHTPEPSFWGRMFSSMPTDTLRMSNPTGAHVPVGRGQHVPVGTGGRTLTQPPPPNFVTQPVSIRGGIPTSPAQQGGHGSTNLPPPSGPSGHVGVGRGQFR